MLYWCDVALLNIVQHAFGTLDYINENSAEVLYNGNTRSDYIFTKLCIEKRW